MRYKILLEYDGRALIGFQKNKDGPSVQSLVEEAIYKFSGQHAELVGCGRTDAGVHALAMPAHFDLHHPSSVIHHPLTVKRALNFYLLDAPVSVTDCAAVDESFHARFDCKMRHYEYRILSQDFPPVFEKNRCWHIPRPLNVKAMQTATKELIGTHDFTSFRAAECQAKSPIKTIDSIQLSIVNCQLSTMILRLSAKSFLHHQVRNIVGTLVEIGHGKPLDIRAILAARDRSAAGPTAPAAGLFFIRADY